MYSFEKECELKRLVESVKPKKESWIKQVGKCFLILFILWLVLLIPGKLIPKYEAYQRKKELDILYNQAMESVDAMCEENQRQGP